MTENLEASRNTFFILKYWSLTLKPAKTKRHLEIDYGLSGFLAMHPFTKLIDEEDLSLKLKSD